MTKKEYLEKVNDTAINPARIKRISDLYKTEFNDQIKKMISLSGKVDFFDEERRALTFQEIIDGVNLLGIDVISKRILPLIDAYDCTYIVYLIDKKKWAKYSVADQIIYKEKDALEEIL